MYFIEKKKKTRSDVVYTENVRANMSSPSASVHEGHAPLSDAPNVERYLADIRANLLLFEETHDICMGLRDILDSCTRPVQTPHVSIG